MLSGSLRDDLLLLLSGRVILVLSFSILLRFLKLIRQHQLRDCSRSSGRLLARLTNRVAIHDLRRCRRAPSVCRRLGRRSVDRLRGMPVVVGCRLVMLSGTTAVDRCDLLGKSSGRNRGFLACARGFLGGVVALMRINRTPRTLSMML